MGPWEQGHSLVVKLLKPVAELCAPADAVISFAWVQVQQNQKQCGSAMAVFCTLRCCQVEKATGSSVCWECNTWISDMDLGPWVRTWVQAHPWQSALQALDSLLCAAWSPAAHQSFSVFP